MRNLVRGASAGLLLSTSLAVAQPAQPPMQEPPPEHANDGVPAADPHQDEHRALERHLDETRQELAEARARIAAIEARPSPPSVEHRDGFVISTGNGDYQLALGGYIQGRYDAMLREGEAEAAGFRLRRARWSTSATLGPNLGLHGMIDAVSDPLLVYAFADWSCGGGFTLRVGLDKTPWTRSWLVLEDGLTFLENAHAADSLRWGDDLGVQLRWRHDKASALLAIGNGAVQGAPDEVPAASARAQVAVLGSLIDAEGRADDLARSDEWAVTLGAGVVIDAVVPGAIATATGAIDVDNDVDDDGDPGRVLVFGASADLAVRHRGLEVVGEVVYRRDDWEKLFLVNPALAAAVGGGAVRSWSGAYLDATYLVPRVDLLVGGRVGWNQLPFFSLVGESALPAGRDATEVAGTIAYLRAGRRLVGATYSLLHFDGTYAAATAGGNRHRVIVETQLSF